MDSSTPRDRPTSWGQAFTGSIGRLKDWLGSMTSQKEIERLQEEAFLQEYLNDCGDSPFNVVEDDSLYHFHNVMLIRKTLSHRVTVAVGTDGVTISRKVNDKLYSKFFRIDTIKRYSWSHWDGAFQMVVSDHNNNPMLREDNYCVVLKTSHHQDMFDTLSKCIEKRLRAQQEHANGFQSEHQLDQSDNSEIMILDNANANSHPLKRF